MRPDVSAVLAVVASHVDRPVILKRGERAIGGGAVGATGCGCLLGSRAVRTLPRALFRILSAGLLSIDRDIPEHAVHCLNELAEPVRVCDKDVESRYRLEILTFTQNTDVNARWSNLAKP